MKIQITIEKNGEVKIEVFDATGQKCLKTKQLEEKLGITKKTKPSNLSSTQKKITHRR